MNVLSRLVIAIAVTCVATAAIVFLQLYSLPQAGLVVLAATIAVALLPSVGSTPSPAASPVEPAGEGREEGTVKWFNVSKGFGFIIRENGDEIFVHFRSIRGPGKGRRALRDGQRVSFTVVQSDKGPQAEEVEPVS